MPKKKNRSKGKKQTMSLFAFTGVDTSQNNDLPSGPSGLPTGPRGSGGGGRYNDRDREPWKRRDDPPSRAEQSSSWRTSGGGGGRFGGPSRGGWGGNTQDSRQGGGFRDRNRFETQDSRFSGDSRPAHLRNRFGGRQSKRELEEQKAQEEAYARRKAQEDERAAEKKRLADEAAAKDRVARQGTYELSNEVSSYKNAKSPLQIAIEEVTSVSVDQLTESFDRLDFKKTEPVDVGLTLANSMVDKKFTISQLIESLEAHCNDDKATVLVAVMQKLHDKGKTALKAVMDDNGMSSVTDALRGSKSDADLDAYLEEVGLAFMKPVPDLRDEIAAALKASTSPDAVIKMIDAKLAADQTPSNLAPVIATHVAGLVFVSKTEANLDAIAPWVPVFNRCKTPEDVEAESNVLFVHQRMWVKSGSNRKFILATFQKLYECKIVSYDGVAVWRDDRSKANKKGKAQALLGCNSWITEITPVIPEEDDEEEDDEEEERIDVSNEYLKSDSAGNPNAAFF